MKRFSEGSGCNNSNSNIFVKGTADMYLPLAAVLTWMSELDRFEFACRLQSRVDLWSNVFAKRHRRTWFDAEDARQEVLYQLYRNWPTKRVRQGSSVDECVGFCFRSMQFYLSNLAAGLHAEMRDDNLSRSYEVVQKFERAVGDYLPSAEEMIVNDEPIVRSSEVWNRACVELAFDGATMLV